MMCIVCDIKERVDGGGEYKLNMGMSLTNNVHIELAQHAQCTYVFRRECQGIQITFHI